MAILPNSNTYWLSPIMGCNTIVIETDADK